MRDAIRLGRVFGIPVGVSWTLVLIVGLLTYDLAVSLPGGLTVAAVLVAAIAAVIFFASVLLHELAHSVVARRAGVRVDGITLWLLGGVSRLGSETPSASAEFRIAIAGPATSVALAVGFGLLWVVAAALALPAVVTAALGWLAVINGVLAVFNLIPAAPLDGGRVLGAALWARSHDRDQAQIGAARAGRVFGWLLVAFGVWTFLAGTGIFGLWFVLLGWFVLSFAGAEARFYGLRRSLRAVSVGAAMTPVRTDEPGWLTVEAFADHVDPTVGAFIVDDWRTGPAGLVTADMLRRVSPAARASTRVLDVAEPLEHLRSAESDEDLSTAWSRPTPGRLPHLIVRDGGHIVGVVTPDNLRRASRSSPRRSLPI
jgi:Zn-dependent protease